MNTTRVTTRALWLSSQLRFEAARWQGPGESRKRSELIRAALQLGHQARILTPTGTTGVRAAIAVIDAGLALLVKAQTERALARLDTLTTITIGDLT